MLRHANAYFTQPGNYVMVCGMIGEDKTSGGVLMLVGECENKFEVPRVDWCVRRRVLANNVFDRLSSEFPKCIDDHQPHTVRVVFGVFAWSGSARNKLWLMRLLNARPKVACGLCFVH